MNKLLKIESKMNGMVLSMAEANNQFNARQRDLIVTQYINAQAQKWILSKSDQSEGDFVIRNFLSQKAVIDVENGSSSLYMGIVCVDFNGKDNQSWKIKPYKNIKKLNEKDVYYIQNVKSGFVLQIEGGIDEEGMRVVQNKQYDGNLNQLWVFHQEKGGF